jgi:Zn-dependent M16 (insulinase) family peptidase
MEVNWLNSLDQYVTIDEGKEMLKETAALKKRQATDDSEEALANLPHLKVSDLSRELYTPPTTLDKDLYDSLILPLTFRTSILTTLCFYRCSVA